MKQKFFTLVLMLAMVFVASSAWAQDKWTPYPGGTYSYSLDYEVANGGSSIALTLSDQTNMTISGTTTPAGLTNNGTAVTGVATGTGVISFSIKYLDAASGTETIRVDITDGSASGCSNFIVVQVVIANMPTLALSITATDLVCQAQVASPANNTAATVPVPVTSPLVNTITFTVEPTIQYITNYSYGYTLTIPTDLPALNSYAISYDGPGTATEGIGSIVLTGITDEEVATEGANGEFTVTFVTTTGEPAINILGTLSAATLTDPVNLGTYTGTWGTQTATSTVDPVPAIGTIAHPGFY